MQSNAIELEEARSKGNRTKDPKGKKEAKSKNRRTARAREEEVGAQTKKEENFQFVSRQLQLRTQ
jgi:hypothetical protein